MIGHILDNRYKILEKVGTGGMASVYKAQDILLDRIVAVKVLHAKYGDDHDFVVRFRQEAQAAAKLSHPNIVNIYDVGYDENVHYIVMEFVRGETLKEYIEKHGHLPINTSIQIAFNIGEALENAHANGIVHCDIKPHNILVTETGRIKVADFGIARAVNSVENSDRTVLGSVHYFSPEQSAGAKGDKTLIVGTEPTFPPFEFTENDKDVGFDIDLAQAICDKLGYKMEVKNLGFDALIPALKSGQIDIIAAGMDATEERKKQINFTDVYYQGGYTIVVPVGNTDITGYDSIAGKTVGAQVGSKAADYAREHGANVKEFDTNTQGWMELEAGTCDAVSIDQAVAQYYLQQGGKDKLKLVGTPITSRGVAMGISKDKQELTDQVNQALKELKADGTYDKIYQKWFGTAPNK